MKAKLEWVQRFLKKWSLMVFIITLGACSSTFSGGQWLQNAWDGKKSTPKESRQKTASVAKPKKKRAKQHPLLAGGRWLEEAWSGKKSSRSYQYKKQSGGNIWSQDNPRISKFRKYYSSSKSSIVRVSLQRSEKYMPYIIKTFKKHKLPLELAYLPMLESAFKTDAVSPTGARGLWQFITSTAKEQGLKVGWLRDERYDWKKATHAAALYLVQLKKRYRGDWELVLASYNGGPNYVARQIKQQKTRNYWKLKLRQEPYEYVPRFLAMLQVARRKYPQLYQI